MFWQNLPKPFFAMAPMADVTDIAFRSLVARRGKPDVMFTEFVSADGLYHTREIPKSDFGSGYRSQTSVFSDKENQFLRDLAFAENQRPIVAQIFSSKPEMIAYATETIAKLGFDGVDLNMGCPDRAIERQGAGAALMKNPKLAVELIRAAQEASALPVSVKTRVGYREESLDEWLGVLLSARPAAITIHLRTRKELSLVPAEWGLMKKAVALRDRLSPETLLIGNGDARDLADARAKAADSGCDGVMLGRAVFGNPWIFEGLRKSQGLTKSEHGLDEKLSALVEFAHDFENILPHKNFAILKKHIKAFVAGFDGAAELRARLMEAGSAAALEAIVAKYDAS